MITYRNIFTYSATTLSLVSCVAVNNDSKEPSREQVYSRPNILFILADDISYDMFGCYGNRVVSTPNLDRLSDQGVYFATAWSSALSQPARIQQLTGRYANTTGIWANSVHAQTPTAVMEQYQPYTIDIQEAGYKTAIAGKWHVSSIQPYDPRSGFDEYSITAEQDILEEFGYEGQWQGGWFEDKNRPSFYWHPAIVENGVILDTKQTDFAEIY